MAEEQKITYDVKDEVQFRLWLRHYIEAYAAKLDKVEKELKKANTRLAILILFFIVIPVISALLGFCS